MMIGQAAGIARAHAPSGRELRTWSFDDEAAGAALMSVAGALVARLPRNPDRLPSTAVDPGLPVRRLALVPARRAFRGSWAGILGTAAHMAWGARRVRDRSPRW
jgi:hypothetical protein